MADDEEDGCDICFESYRCPKLLPCRHTFCEPCLRDYGENTCPQDLYEFLVCPLCRTHCVLPSCGVGGFINNYFVPDSLTSDRSNLTYKHYPKCNFCKVTLLSDDVRDHRCKMSSELSSDESDDSDYDYNDTSLGFILHFPLLKMRTKYKVDLHSAYPVVTGDCDDALITCLHITPENKCYTVVNCMSTYQKHDSSGKCIGETTITPDTQIIDMVYRKDNSVLFQTKNEIYVVNEAGVKLFRILNNFEGVAMAMFSDERVVTVGTALSVEKRFKTKDASSLDLEKEQPELSTKGKIVILSRDGKTILADLSRDNCSPSVVAVNQINDTICMSDTERKLVSVFLQSGDVIGEFNLDGRVMDLFRFLPMFQQGESRGFSPAGICFDPDGNILVVDQASASVLMLDNSAGFIGILVTGAEGGFGHPFLIGCGSDRTIWVGDRGRIKVFNVAGYVNDM
ncbi:uncharacterized protein LOC117321380 [Pecten maximus]|uniref:uncharacterized protein LOC117321380 n=1 Tax=Pecten maximus TaxID=6579 RepID=UPI001458BA3E|nr:uncharacterized protein LOC117321380 [Pecten maximus]